MKVKFLGSGDAFGSGGRFNTCILVEGGAHRFLVDCGATALVSLRRFEVDPNSLDAILISHLHGDHFGGLPFVLLDARYASHRTKPLTLAGPPGLADRLTQTMEVLFPGSSTVERAFPLHVVEIKPDQTVAVGDDLAVTAAEVVHPSGAPSLALRILCGGRCLAYTGDTEWTDALLRIGEGADLLIAECYAFDGPIRYHLNYRTWQDKAAGIGAKRIVLTHMSAGMLARLPEVAFETASDGLEISLA